MIETPTEIAVSTSAWIAVGAFAAMTSRSTSRSVRPGPAVTRAVLLRVGVDDDRHVRAPRVEELAHEEPAGLGRAAPVDVAAVVARLVLAQRVEGEVAHRDVLGGAALEVAQQAGAERLERDGARVDEELGALGPRQRAAHEAERVALDGRRRAHLDDAAARGRHDEELLVGVARGQRRQDEPGRRQADGQLDEDRQHRRARLVGDEDPARRGLADDDPSRVDLGEDAHLRATEREHEADREEHEGGRGDHEQLGPAPAGADEPADDAEREDRPAERRDPPKDPGDGAPHALGLVGDLLDRARDRRGDLADAAARRADGSRATSGRRGRRHGRAGTGRRSRA